MIYFLMCASVWALTYWLNMALILLIEATSERSVQQWQRYIVGLGAPTAVTFLYYQMG